MIITGLPATGKTTLARDLARRHALPLISKDVLKEPLLDMLEGRAASHELSSVAFAVMFSMTQELLALGQSLILEGNFRTGSHEAPLLAALPAAPPAIVQVLCTADEHERRSRLLSRATDPNRHPGHRDAHQLEPVAACDSFLELPGERLQYRVGLPLCENLL